MNISTLYCLVITAVLHLLTDAKRDKTMFCLVCRAMVSEVTWRIGDADPKKMLQVGSFRVDPKGNQKLVEKQYAKSDLHLTEIFENVCHSMSDYTITTDNSGLQNIVRTYSRDGKQLSLKNVRFNLDVQKKLQFYCDTLVEEHEEEMIALFKGDNLPSLEAAVCGDIARACSKEDLAHPLPVLEAEEERENLPNAAEEETLDKSTTVTINDAPDSQGADSDSGREIDKEDL